MLSIPDMAMLGAAALLLFGPEQLPKVARKAGSVMRDIQNTSQSFIREMERAADLQEVAATKAEPPPPYEPAAYDPAPYDAVAEEHAADGTLPYESEPYDVTAHPVTAAYEPPAPDPEMPLRRSAGNVAEKLAEPQPALGPAEPSAPAEAAPQTNHAANL
jgi:sec-independent protein translocase protein TatA